MQNHRQALNNTAELSNRKEKGCGPEIAPRRWALVTLEYTRRLGVVMH
jgi:hypothetical protein